MGGHRSTNSLGRMSEEDEEESPSGGRCITAKPAYGSGPQSGSPRLDPVMFRRTSSRESGGSVATPSSGLGPLSSAGIFKSPPSPESVARTRAVVPTDDVGGRSPVYPSPQQMRTVSDESMSMQPPPQQQKQQQHVRQQQQQQQQQQLPSMQQQQLQAMQQQHQQQQFGGVSRPAAGGAGGMGGGGGTQWDDVVGRMTTPQTSGHSLEMNSVDLNSNGSQAPIKPELDALLQTSNNSVGTWNSNDSQAALLGPMPPPQAVQPPLRGWSFDSAQQGAENSTGNMVVDLSDVNTLFHEGDGSAAAAATTATTAASTATGSRGSSADAGAGRQQQQQQEAMSNAKWGDEGVLPMEKVVIEPSRDVSGIRLPVHCLARYYACALRVYSTYVV